MRQRVRQPREPSRREPSPVLRLRRGGPARRRAVRRDAAGKSLRARGRGRGPGRSFLRHRDIGRRLPGRLSADNREAVGSEGDRGKSRIDRYIFPRGHNSAGKGRRDSAAIPEGAGLMRLLYFDCFAGVSGDMIIGALLDLGLGLGELRGQLASLDLSGYELSAGPVKRGGIAATKFEVKVDDASQPARRLADIAEIILKSAISDESKARSLRVFERLAGAEARVHASTKDRVHFHEVGAVDSIIDIVGSVIGFELLEVEQVISSPLRVGRGSVRAAHGLLPVPAPGTAELLKGVPVYAGEIDGEFVTPTGAAILTSFSTAFRDLPA